MLNGCHELPAYERSFCSPLRRSLDDDTRQYLEAWHVEWSFRRPVRASYFRCYLMAALLWPDLKSSISHNWLCVIKDGLPEDLKCEAGTGCKCFRVSMCAHLAALLAGLVWLSPQGWQVLFSEGWWCWWWRWGWGWWCCYGYEGNAHAKPLVQLLRERIHTLSSAA